MCVCVCVCEKERERQCNIESVYVHACKYAHISDAHSIQFNSLVYILISATDLLSNTDCH